MLPFTSEQFLAVFANYNVAIWPAQIVAYLLGALAVALLIWKPPGTDRTIVTVIAAMWLWTGLAYHGAFFSTINKAAYLFAALFVLQAIVLAYAGLHQNRVRFRFSSGWAQYIGWCFIIYAAILYPLIGVVTGHHYPEMPMFGVAPCPVTIFTFGLLLFAIAPLSIWLLVIPSVWSLIGGSAAVLLNVPQDWLLLASGLVAVPLIARQNRQIMLGRPEKA